MKKKKSDAEIRKEIKEFVRNFNQKNNTDIKVGKAPGTEHRKLGQFGRTTVNHTYYGGTDFDLTGLKEEMGDKFLKELASAGFRTIDERKAKSSVREEGRGIGHVDANPIHPKGKKLRETITGKYIDEGVEPQKYMNEMLDEQKDEQRKMLDNANLESLAQDRVLFGDVIPTSTQGNISIGEPATNLTFKQAFDQARDAGKREFEWKGNKFTTRKADESEEDFQNRFALKEEKDEFLEMLKPYAEQETDEMVRYREAKKFEDMLRQIANRPLKEEIQPESETVRTFQDGGMSYSDPVMNLDEGYLDVIQELAAGLQPEKRQSEMFDDMMPQQKQDFEMPLRDGTLPSQLTKKELTPASSAPERKVASKGSENKSLDEKPKKDLVLEALKKQGKTSEEIDEETKPSLEKLYDEYQRLQGRYEKEIDDKRMGDAIVNSLGTLNRLFETGQDFKSNLGAQAERDRSRRLAEVIRKSNLLGFGTSTNQLSKDPNSPQSIAFRKQFKAMTGEELDAGVSEFMGSKLAREIVAGKRDKYRQEQISGRQEKSQDYRKEEKFIDRINSSIQAMRGTDRWKKADSALSAVPRLRNTLQDAYEKGGQSLAMLGTDMARALAGEVGMLTDKDVTRYIKNPAIIAGLMDLRAKLESGKISDLSYENITRLLDTAEKAAQQAIKQAEQREAKLLSKRLNKPYEDIYEYFDTSEFLNKTDTQKGKKTKSSAGNRLTESEYKKAIKNAKNIEEIEEIKKRFKGK